MKGVFVLAQVASGLEPEENLRKVRAAAQEAYESYRPDVLVFPEYCMSVAQAGAAARAEPLDGHFVTEMRRLAAKYGMWMIFGMNERSEDEGGRYYNTAVVLDGAGEVVAAYRKTHLYDAFHCREPDQMLPGDALFTPIDTPFGRLGLMICYEVRFTEVARYQKEHGAEIVVMPTSWAAGRLKSLHYHTLIRARAIENTLLAVRIDTERIAAVSRVLPSYQNRRTDLYK